MIDPEGVLLEFVEAARYAAPEYLSPSDGYRPKGALGRRASSRARFLHEEPKAVGKYLKEGRPTRYRKGLKPCKRCGGILRFASDGSCVGCRRSATS